MTSIGGKIWAIAGGRIPLRSTGREPDYVSQDLLCFLNTGEREAHIKLTVFYTDRDPVGPYKMKLPPRRILHVRVNDLIDPLPVPLETDYACVVESDAPIVAQMLRRDTSQAENSWLSLPAMAVHG